MLNKLSSDVVTTIVGMAKSQKATANEVKSNHTEVTGRGIPNSRITVILPNGTDHVGYVSAEGEFRIMIPKQEANSRITVIQKKNMYQKTGQRNLKSLEVHFSCQEKVSFRMNIN